MSDIIDVNPAEPDPNPTRKQKPGPKGRVLEPFAKEILLKAREGQSMQDIVNWLADSPRGVVITRQAVHLWVKARIRKLAKLNAAFIDTGIGGPFQESGASWVSRQTKRESGLDPPQLMPIRSAPGTKSGIDPTGKRFDARKFMLEESDLHRVQDPFRHKK